MRVLVTVGMSRWPFDRLIAAAERLPPEHELFGQIGQASLTPRFEHRRFVPFDELQARIAAADVVVTHAGNTVRLAQRAGKVPIAVARQAALGEMANDHQVEFLRSEEQRGRVIAVWDLERLPEVLARQPWLEAEMLSVRAGPPPVDRQTATWLLEAAVRSAEDSPFRHHHLRRYGWAWSWLAGRDGDHLDVGCGRGDFLGPLAASTRLRCFGVDAHPGYVVDCAGRYPHLEVRTAIPSAPLPFAAESFGSVSLLDVLEHVPNEEAAFAEVRRVLEPGGLLLLSVPARHAFSFLDPDNAKYRFPRLHRFVYSRRFGSDVYRERFVDLSNQLRGDISVDRDRHTNYEPADLERRLRAHGFRIVQTTGANLFWRLLQTPALLATGRAREVCERLIELDGRVFSSANLFIAAIKERK